MTKQIAPETYYETILPRRARPQPSPKFYLGGDCGACVLAGLTNLPNIELAYKLFQEDGKIEPWSQPTMRDAVYSAKSKGFLDRIMTHHPSWQVWEGHQTWGSASWKQSLEWYEYINMAIDAGYYGIASINIDGKGPLVETDHLVLICGTRERVEPNKYVEGAGDIIQEIFVSCSAKHPEGRWYEIRDFLTYRGGFNCYLVRPSK